jgi:prepilin peptidase CpaA
MPPISPLFQIFLIALVVVAAIFDFRFRRIPNWLTVWGILAGFLMNIAVGGFAGLKTACLGLLLATSIYFPLYWLRAIGAGDVKLMAAIGSIVGAPTWLGICLVSALVGGVLALVVVFRGGRMRQTLFNIQLITSELAHFRAPNETYPEIDVRNKQAVRLPHGVSIALGTIAFLLLAHFAPDLPIVTL